MIRKAISEMAVAGAADPGDSLLGALSRVLTYEILPEDLRHITLQPHKAGGKITKASVTLSDPDMGETTGTMTQRDVQNLGMSLEDVIMRLEAMGARLVKFRPSTGLPPSARWAR
jgi:hypothetical protein